MAIWCRTDEANDSVLLLVPVGTGTTFPGRFGRVMIAGLYSVR
jgi:hypothetical protein